MAQTYSKELTGIASLPVVKASATAGYGARIKRYRATITLASQASGAGNEIIIAKVPAGMTFAYGVLNTDTSLGTSTLSIGTAATAAKYNNAAQTLTSTNTPVLFGANAQVGASALSSEETIQILVGTAALPSSGQLIVDLYFTNAN